jgi:tetratricopeptide (TPR) repeat protein
MRLTVAAGAMCLLAVFAPMPRVALGQSEAPTQVRVVPTEEQALHDLLVKAKAEADKNNYAAARADYDKYLEQRPNDAAAHFDLGYVYTAQQQSDKAIAEYRKAVALDPKMIQAQLNLGISLLSDDPKAAIEPLQKVIALNYAFERGHYMLGFAEERSGDATAAEKEFTVAVKLNPNDADAHGALARIDLASGKAADAETEFRELLRLKPGDSEAELGLAESLLQQKKTADATEALAAYLKANPSDHKARLMQASALTEMGKNDEALAALDLAAKDGSETAEALKLRSVIYYRKGDFAKEAIALQKAIALTPEDASLHAQLGHALLETKDYAGAVRELNTALRLDPSSTDTMRDLVSAGYLQKDFADTLLTLEALGRRVPLNAGAWFVRGSCYDHMNQPEEALDAYQKFLAMNTDKGSNQYFEATERVRFLQKVVKQKGH